MTLQSHPIRIRATPVPRDISSSLWVMLSVPWEVLAQASEVEDAEDEASQLHVSFTSRSAVICDKSLLMELVLLSGHFNPAELFPGCAGVRGDFSMYKFTLICHQNYPELAANRSTASERPVVRIVFSTTLGVLCAVPTPFAINQSCPAHASQEV